LKKRIILVTASILLITLLLIPTGCVKKATTTTPTVTVEQLQARIASLESKVASQTNQITTLQNQPPPTQTNYQPSIDLLKTDLVTLRTQINNLNTSNIPKYAMVTELGRKYIEVTTYGAGDYPVIVTLYGEGLKVNEVDVEDDDIVDEYLYGKYSLIPSSKILNVSSKTFGVTGDTTFDVSSDTFSISDGTFDVPSGTFETELVEPYTCNAHEHSVTVDGLEVDIEGLEVLVDGLTVDIEGLGVSVSGLTVEGIAYDLVFTGTMLVIVVEPDKEWVANDTFELDVRDVSGDIYYATASVSVGE